MSYEIKRNCPKCNRELVYLSYDSWYNSNRNNCSCRSCSKKDMPNGRLGKKHTYKTKLKMSLAAKSRSPITEETRRKLSISRRNRKITPETKKKLSQSLTGRQLSDKHKLNLSKSNVGKSRSEETKYRIRIATIRDLQKKGIMGKAKNHNPLACRFIDNLNRCYGWNLQHALNGGEVELYGYFVDGYDKEKNIVFEYDEPNHNKSRRKEKDIIRQNRIINTINPNLFIRYDEANNNLYNVKC